MSSPAARASRTLSQAAAQLEQLLQHNHKPADLRDVVDQAYDACGLLMQAASDLECGVET